MLYLGLAAPPAGGSSVGFDDVAFVEWRSAASYPAESEIGVDLVRATG